MPRWTEKHEEIRKRHPDWFQLLGTSQYCEGLVIYSPAFSPEPQCNGCPSQSLASYKVAGHYFCGVHQPTAAVHFDYHLQLVEHGKEAGNGSH